MKTFVTKENTHIELYLNSENEYDRKQKKTVNEDFYTETLCICRHIIYKFNFMNWLLEAIRKIDS